MLPQYKAMSYKVKIIYINTNAVTITNRTGLNILFTINIKLFEAKYELKVSRDGHKQPNPLVKLVYIPLPFNGTFSDYDFCYFKCFFPLRNRDNSVYIKTSANWELVLLPI